MRNFNSGSIVFSIQLTDSVSNEYSILSFLIDLFRFWIIDTPNYNFFLVGGLS